MAEPDSRPSKAEQRQLAVEKLRRAASLPRMKDGRRPPMHVEAVSESEKPSPDIPDEKKLESPPSEDIPPPQQPTTQSEPEPEPEPVDPEPEPEVDMDERGVSPGPPGRSKRRSRSRSRSRGSRDFKGKARNLQSPVPPSVAGDSSPDDDEPPIPTLHYTQPPVPPIALLSPIPSHTVVFNPLLRSQTPDPSMLYANMTAGLPSLEAIQKGLFRSNSTNGSAAASRRQAFAKLTGGAETYDPQPPTTPPPFYGKLSRNNTVAGGERIAARQILLTRLNGRIAKEAEAEASGSEERGGPSPTPKRRKRRSRRGSMSAAAAGTSDTEAASVPTDAPAVPQEHHFIRPSDHVLEMRAQSTTPIQALFHQRNGVSDVSDPTGEPASAADVDNQRSIEPTRRRSVLIEDEDDEEPEEEHQPEQQQSYAQQFQYPVLPSTPPRVPTRVPHSSDAPSHTSTDSGMVTGIGVPIFLSQRSSSRNDIFPTSPFPTPWKERQSEEEEEQVLFHHDNYRARTPFSANANNTDAQGREISWVADSVPVLPNHMSVMIEDDDDGLAPEVEDEDDNGDGDKEEEEGEEEDEAFEEPLSPTSSQQEQEQVQHVLPSPHITTQPLVVEAEASPELRPELTSISPSQSIDVARMSPISFPARLSVASRIQGSPLATDEWEEQPSSAKRIGDVNASPSTWEKVKSTFTRHGTSGRRSRSNSLATRERRDQVNSSVSRESGASLTKIDKSEGPLQAPQLMQTPSASASILSLSPHTLTPSRGAPSPIPPATSADMSRYQNAKLFPFPGITRLEEMQRNKVRAAGNPAASASTPEINTGFPGVVDEDQPLQSASSANNTPAHTPEMSRERTLSHQASDSKLMAKFNGGSPSNGPNGKSSKLPMTLPGVKQWLSKNNRKLFSSSSHTPQALANTTSSSESGNGSLPSNEKSRSGNKKGSLSDLLKRRGSESGPEWEVSTSKSANGDYVQPNTTVSTNGISVKPVASSSSSDSNEQPTPFNSTADVGSHADTEKTPRVKKITPLDIHSSTNIIHTDESPSPSSHVPSRSDPFLSPTPDPSSSLSDYPLRSTSRSTSSSSQYSVVPQGAAVIERLEESFARNPRAPALTTLLEGPPRKALVAGPVFQVVNQKAVKDRFLFLFSDILVITKPVFSRHEKLFDFKNAKIGPPDRKHIVKNVVLFKDVTFCSERVDTTPKSPSYSQPGAKNPVLKKFVVQFSENPDAAVKFVLSKFPALSDPMKLGQFLFRTADLDRARIGEYLGIRSRKAVLTGYLDGFGFTGVRIDKALRMFLFSINVPNSSPALDQLLEVFACRWYNSNSSIIAYDERTAYVIIHYLVILNNTLHGFISDEPGPTGYPIQPCTCKEFVDTLKRRLERGYLISEEVLEALYDSIRGERLCFARITRDEETPDIPVTFRRPAPSYLTYKVLSEPIVLRIPQVDPDFTIHLEGQDLQFEPSVLSFAKSSEASFRMMGTKLGSKTMLMCRSGPNALRYTGLPISNKLIVERAFMRNTFQIAFADRHSTKRRYMFSVDDPVWASHLRQCIENAPSASGPASESSKFMKVAEQVSLKILQRTLIEGSEALSSPQSKSSLIQTFSKKQMNGNGYRHPGHVRSKSRSQIYRHNAGQNELDLNYDSSSQNELPSSDLSETDNDATDIDQYSGPLWTREELRVVCTQNSIIPQVMSILHVGALAKEAEAKEALS